MFTNIPLKYEVPAMRSLIYGMATVTNIIHMFLLYKCQIVLPTQTLQIDWDFDNEVFIVTRPNGILGGVAKIIVQPQNFK